ncbi:Pectin lyase-like superfamily protein [Zea mays]|uniref:Pectin lyase-like superfamily protein n=1 Tax=Zea mays TaxID=4577 RepID=A0A1D6LRG1_MAIZE|nr:Pectin lyase-like superfamily protein [Zea mays]
MGIGMWRHREVDNPHIQGRLPCRTTQLHRPMQGRRDHPGGWQSAGVTMDDVNVEYSGTNNKTMAICTNAKGSTKGCLKDLACF